MPSPQAKLALFPLLRSYFFAITAAAGLAMVLRIFVVEAFRIPTDFMSPLLLPGDHIFVNKLAFTGLFGSPPKSPRRGEVVVFSFPSDPTKDYIKRVIAIGGDEVEIRASQVFVNGKSVSKMMENDLFEEELDGHRYFARWTGVEPERRKMMPVTVPKDQVFVLGDNRAKGQDSRIWGFIDKNYLKGRAALVWFSSGLGSGDAGVLGLRWDRMFTRIR